MRTKSKSTNADNCSLWNWNGSTRESKSKNKQFPVTEFLQENYRKVEENLIGPGVGFGIGCGIGAGIALVGGVGWPWNDIHPKLVFGVGIGCGVGVGLGYGQGLGYGLGLDSMLEPSDSKCNSDLPKRFAIDI